MNNLIKTFKKDKEVVIIAQIEHIDGVNNLACIKSHTDINGDLNVYPLPHLKVIKDLIGDLSTLYKQYESIPVSYTHLTLPTILLV